jgi:glucose/arabinose dehydrogenase
MTTPPIRHRLHVLARRGVLALALPLVAVALAQAADRTPASDTLLGTPFQTIAANLAHPDGITHAGDGSGRVFITLQDGKIVVWDGTHVLPAPFLDIDPLVNSTGTERGLLGLAFHPDYESNGYFYVDYTDTTGGDTVIARYQVSAADPNAADPASALILMELDQPFANHNGGQLAFGPDGYLYIGMGDGGSAGDPGNRAQDLTKPLGKILRIDVNGGGLPADCGGGSNYTIPPDNPFVDGPGGNCDEIWQSGLRNPWRFSFDRLTGDLFIGDVGQDNWEEVDFQPAGSRGGANWGWRCYEGNHPFNTQGCGPAATYDFPIFEYSHAIGCAVVSGFVYRGSVLPPGAQGGYFFGDYCSGRVWIARQVSGSWAVQQVADTNLSISAFGETESGEVCVAHYGGVLGATGRVICALP